MISRLLIATEPCPLFNNNNNNNTTFSFSLLTDQSLSFPPLHSWCRRLCFALVCPCFRPCIRDYMCPQYLQYLLMDFCQTFVIGAPWDKDEVVRFWGQKVKGQGHIIAADASSTRLCRRLQLSSSRVTPVRPGPLKWTFRIYWSRTFNSRIPFLLPNPQRQV